MHITQLPQRLKSTFLKKNCSSESTCLNFKKCPIDFNILDKQWGGFLNCTFFQILSHYVMYVFVLLCCIKNWRKNDQTMYVLCIDRLTAYVSTRVSNSVENKMVFKKTHIQSTFLTNGTLSVTGSPLIGSHLIRRISLQDGFLRIEIPLIGHYYASSSL